MLTGKKYTKHLPIWGGIECSLNRVKDRYFDQLEQAGHYNRLSHDIAVIAELGVRVLRYPVIWERNEPVEGLLDFSFADQSLATIKAHGIDPIVGLVHHGSGPAYCPVDNGEFPAKLARYAEQVARRYPWVQYYTPVNEPLTTARFCGLYGLWYPHGNSDRVFVRILLNELRAVVESMKAIRRINPDAWLVQTEDLGKTYATPLLQYQADFENCRRFLTYDLLCGKVDKHHELWEFLRGNAEENELMYFVENPCPPDLIGLDYYPTSERYLDERLYLYPVHTHGGNGRDAYADVEAFRVRHRQQSGIEMLLKEYWDRYQLPMAITEVHIHCDDDSQIRWFWHVWNACWKLMQQGVDIRAITSWALLGSFGWNKLLTESDGIYEAGVFNVSSGKPIMTTLGKFVSEVIRDNRHDHHAIQKKGWWEREDRFIAQHRTLA